VFVIFLFIVLHQNERIVYSTTTAEGRPLHFVSFSSFCLFSSTSFSTSFSSFSDCKHNTISTSIQLHLQCLQSLSAETTHNSIPHLFNFLLNLLFNFLVTFFLILLLLFLLLVLLLLWGWFGQMRIEVQCLADVIPVRETPAIILALSAYCHCMILMNAKQLGALHKHPVHHMCLTLCCFCF